MRFKSGCPSYKRSNSFLRQPFWEKFPKSLEKNLTKLIKKKPPFNLLAPLSALTFLQIILWPTEQDSKPNKLSWQIFLGQENISVWEYPQNEQIFSENKTVCSWETCIVSWNLQRGGGRARTNLRGSLFQCNQSI